jgi:divalent metal cation (Fe/Co/Zn/Cd) transporter
VATAVADRYQLERRARTLAWIGNAWHLIEFGVALGAGIAASSVALVAFGIDSLIELAAGGVIIWLFSGGRGASHDAERRAQQLIALSFYALALYVVIASLHAFSGAHPRASWVGIGLALIAAPTMPILAHAKRRVGRQLGSGAAQSEGRQNMLCAYLAIALLVGLAANALFGLWWADPLAGLVIAAAAVREGREAWRGEAHDDCC